MQHLKQQVFGYAKLIGWISDKPIQCVKPLEKHEKCKLSRNNIHVLSNTSGGDPIYAIAKNEADKSNKIISPVYTVLSLKVLHSCSILCVQKWEYEIVEKYFGSLSSDTEVGKIYDSLNFDLIYLQQRATFVTFRSHQLSLFLSITVISVSDLIKG